jgi:aspartate racemase
MDRPAGILGGLGPMATVFFMGRVVDLTESDTDQGHVDMIVWNQASTPDRTAYLVGASEADPLPAMLSAAAALERSGAAFIAMPCNTAHQFYDALADSVGVPFLNIVQESVAWARERVPGLATLGVMATDGTVLTGTYEQECRRVGVACVVPAPAVQAEVMDMIYAGVKAGRRVDPTRFHAVLAHLRDRGCEAIVLGCTELSVLARDLGVTDGDVIDSVDALARATIRASGKRIREQA